MGRMGGTAERPFVIVGSPRSGTTLLRVMLDGHPRLAVTDESHFVVGLAPRWWTRSPGPALDAVLAHPRVARWDVDLDALAAAARRRPHGTFPEAVRAIFEAYAEVRGKPRWGDKTPGYVTHLPFLADLLPDAQFVHVLRDGRQVAASLAQWDWGPPTAVSGAWWWSHKVRVGRRSGSALGVDRYHELRLEDLIDDPAGVLGALCRFLGEDYDDAMLDYPARSVASGAGRPDQEVHLTRPPTAGLRDWRAGLTRRQQAAVEEVCRRQLAAAGYEPPAARPASWPYAVGVRALDLARTAPAAVRARLFPGTREF
jgi:hypothetical protein